MHCLTIRIVEIDGRSLMLMLRDMSKVHPKIIAQLAKLSLALVLDAKLKRILRSVLRGGKTRDEMEIQN